MTRYLEIAAQLLREPGVPPSDQLPYPPEFEAIHGRLCALIGREISFQEVWKAIIGARKRGLIGPSRRRRRAVAA